MDIFSVLRPVLWPYGRFGRRILDGSNVLLWVLAVERVVRALRAALVAAFLVAVVRDERVLASPRGLGTRRTKRKTSRGLGTDRRHRLGSDEFGSDGRGVVVVLIGRHLVVFGMASASCSRGSSSIDVGTNGTVIYLNQMIIVFIGRVGSKT